MVKLLRVLYSILYLIYSVSSDVPKPPDFVKCVDEKCGTLLYTTKNVDVQSERESSSLLPLNEPNLSVKVFSLPNSLGFVLAEVNGRRGLVRTNILEPQKPPQSVPVDSFESVHLYTLTDPSVFKSIPSDDIGPTAPSRHEHTDSPHNASQTESHTVTDTAPAAAVTVTDANVTSDPVGVTTHSESGSSRTPPSNNNNSSSAVADITGQLSGDTEHGEATLSGHQLSAALSDIEQQQPEDGQRQSTPAEQQPNPAISENNEQLPSPEQLPAQQLQQQQEEGEKLEQQQQDQDRDHREQQQQQQQDQDRDQREQQQQEQDKDRDQREQQQQQQDQDRDQPEQQQQQQDQDREQREQQQQQQQDKDRDQREHQQQDQDRDQPEQQQQQQDKDREQREQQQQQQDQDRDQREQQQQQQDQDRDQREQQQQQQDQDRDQREQQQQQQDQDRDQREQQQQEQDKDRDQREQQQQQQQDKDRDQREQQQQEEHVVNNGSSEESLMATNSSLLTNGSVSAGGTNSVTSGVQHLPGIDKLLQSRHSHPKRSVVSPHSAESVSALSNLAERDPYSSQSPEPDVAGHAADDVEDVSLPGMSTEVSRPPTDTLGSETSGSEIDADSDDAHHSKQLMDLHSGESSSDARSRGNGEFSSPEDWQESDPNAAQRSSSPNPAETKQDSETSPSVTDVSGDSSVTDGFCVGNAFVDPSVGSCRDTDISGWHGLSLEAEEPSPKVAGSVEVSDVISETASDAGFDQDSLSTDTSSQTPDVETPGISREQEQEPDGIVRSTIDSLLPAWLCVLLDGAAGGSGGGSGGGSDGPARVTVLLCSVGLTLTLLTTCFRLTTIFSRDFSLKRTISRQQRAISVLTQQVKQLMREADSHSRQLTEVSVQERDEALMAARADRQAVEQQLTEAQDEIGRLSGKVAQLQQLLEEQNSSLQSAQSGANAAIVDTVNKLERQLKQQQRKQLAVVDKLKLENKHLLAELNADKEQLTMVLLQLEESRGAVETKSRDLQELQLKVQLSTDNCQQLEDKCTELSGQQLTLSEQLAELKSERTRLQSLLHEAQERTESLASEVTVLTDLVKQQQQQQQPPDSDTQPDGDPCQQLLDAVKLKAQLDKLTRDKAKLEEERQQQQQQLESLQERESSVRSELEAVGKRCEQTELAKYEAESKLDHLEKYFHKKELAFHEEVGELKHRVSLTSGDASHTQQRLQQLTAEAAEHQRLVDSLKLEIQEQERSFRERLQSAEKEAHESWLARRAAERRLEQANREAAQIRAMLLQREEVNGSSLTDRASLHSLAVNGALTTDSPVQDVEAAMYGKPSMMGFMTPSPPPPMSLPFLPPPPPSSSQPLSLDARSDSLFYEPPPLPPPPLAPPVLNERRSAPYSPSPRRRGSSPTADSEYSRHSSGRHRHQRRHHLDYEQQQQRHLHGGSGRRQRHAHSSDDTSGNDTRDEGARYTPEPPPLMMPTGGHSGTGAHWSPPRPIYDQNDVKELGGTGTRLYRPQPVSGPKTSSPLVLPDSFPQ